MPQIIVTVDADGKTRVEAAGVVGPSCMQLTAALEKALGHKTADVGKPEILRVGQSLNNGVQQKS